MIDAVYCVRKHVAAISLHNGVVRQRNWQLGMDHNRLRSGLWLLQLAVRRATANGNPLPNVEFIVNPTDKTANFASGKQMGDKRGNRLRQVSILTLLCLH